MMEIASSRIPFLKLIFHCVQIAVSFTCWILEIVVFRGGDATSLNGWTFGVCFLSAPAWVYLIGTPRYARTRRFASAKAMLSIDALMAVLWLSGFATQAAYNTGNHCGTACGVSKAVVGLAFFETVLWVITTYFSVMTHTYYQANGTLPGYDSNRNGRPMRGGGADQNIDPDKAAFSTAPIGGGDEEAYAPLGRHDHDHNDDDEQEFNATPYGGAQNSYNGSSSGGGGSGGGGAGLGAGGAYNPPRHGSHTATGGSGDVRYDTSYGGGGASGHGSISGGSGSGSGTSPPHRNPFEDHGEFGSGSHIYAPPAVHDEGADDGRPAQFPAGNYGRIH